MKRILFFTILAAISFNSFSQRKNREMMNIASREMSVEELAKQQTDELDRIVSLDSTQYQLVYIMNYADISAFHDSMKVRRERIEKDRKSGKRPERKPRSREDFEVRRKIAEQRKQKRNESMKEVLSPEQYTKYLDYEATRQNRMNRGNRRGEPGLQ